MSDAIRQSKMSAQGRNLAVDGLRGIAILLVLLYHLTPGGQADAGLRTLGFKVANAGWMGVDLFLVLSGFLITSILLSNLGQKNYFRGFYTRRVLRIFPLYYATLIAVFVLLPLLSRWSSPEAASQLPYWLYYSNFMPGQFDLPVHLGHLWSLAVEEQFYLVWPAVVALAGPKRLRGICIALVVLVPALRAILVLRGMDWPATYLWTPSRLDSLAAGSLLATVPRDALRAKRLAWFALAIAGAIAAWYIWRNATSLMFKQPTAGDLSSPYSVSVILTRALFPSILATMFFSVLLLATRASLPRPVQRLLECRFLRLFGKYSYALYVFHFVLAPVFEAQLLPLIQRMGSPFADTQLGIWLYFVTTTVLSLAFALISWRLLERPLLDLKDKLAPRRDDPIGVPPVSSNDPS